MNVQLIQMISEPDFLLRVAMGKVEGASFVRKFGENPSIQSGTPADVWEYGQTSGAEIYTFSSGNDIDTMSSSNAGDTGDITIEGVQLDGTAVIQTKALIGQAKVTLDTPIWRLNRAYNNNSTDLLGNVYIYEDGVITLGVPDDETTVRGYISIGNGQTLQSIYTIEGGKTGFLMGIEASLSRGVTATGNADFKAKARLFGKVFRTQGAFSLSSSGSSERIEPLSIPVPFPSQTDFVPNVNVSVNNMGFSLSFTILLLNNEIWNL